MNPETIHREMFAAWNARDFNRMLSMLHSEYTFTGPDGIEHSGSEAAMAVAQMYASAFPDATVTVDRVHTVGNTAIAECTGRGTHGGNFFGHAPTHNPVVTKICNIVEMRDGKVYREREYLDVAGMLSQIGATSLPQRAAGA